MCNCGCKTKKKTTKVFFFFEIKFTKKDLERELGENIPVIEIRETKRKV